MRDFYELVARFIEKWISFFFVPPVPGVLGVRDTRAFSMLNFSHEPKSRSPRPERRTDIQETDVHDTQTTCLDTVKFLPAVPERSQGIFHFLRNFF